MHQMQTIAIDDPVAWCVCHAGESSYSFARRRHFDATITTERTYTTLWTIKKRGAIHCDHNFRKSRSIFHNTCTFVSRNKILIFMKRTSTSPKYRTYATSWKRNTDTATVSGSQCSTAVPGVCMVLLFAENCGECQGRCVQFSGYWSIR